MTSLAPDYGADIIGLINITPLAPNDTAGFNNTTITTPGEDGHSLFAYPMAAAIIVLTVTCVVTVVTVLGNSMVLLAFYLERPLRENCSNYLIVSLAACDLLMGAVCPMPTNLNLMLGSWIFGWFFCQLWDTATVSLAIISQTNAFCIAVDRFLGIRFPTRYRSWKTPKKIILFILNVWALPSGFNFYIYYFWTEDLSPDFTIDRPRCFLRMPNQIRVFIYSLTFWVRLLIMCFIYRYLYTVASKINQKSVARKKKPEMVVSSSQAMSHTISYEESNISNQNLSKCFDNSCVTDRLTEHLNERDIVYSRRPRKILSHNAQNITVVCESICEEDNVDNIEGKNYIECKEFISCMDMPTVHGNNARTVDSNTNGTSYGYKANTLTTDTNTNSKASSQYTASTKGSQNQFSGLDVFLNEKSHKKRVKMQSLGEISIEEENSLAVPIHVTDMSTPVDDQLFKQGTWEDEIADTSPDVSQEAIANIIENTFTTNMDDADNQQISKYRMQKAVLTASFIIIANVCCYGPYAFISFAVAVLGQTLHSVFAGTGTFLMFLNSMINPLMYALVNPLFRETFRRICLCRWHRNRRRSRRNVQR